MRRVLIVGADFSPSSLPTAQRIRFLGTHLPEFGWEPTILTTDPRHYETAIDTENERLLPETLNVVRTAAWSTGWTRKLGVGDVGMRSVWHHWKAFSRLHRQNPFDLMFVSVPPYVPMVLGRAAHMRFGIPYVLDYQDPWVTEYYWKLESAQRPPKWVAAYALARALEPVAVRRAAGIVGVSEGTIRSVLSRYSRLDHVVTDAIPLGGEPGDFEYLRSHPRQQDVFDPADGYVHISYVGACIPQMAGTLRALFEAVRQGLDRTPELFRRVRLHFVGTSYSPRPGDGFSVQSIARECRVDEIVTERAARVSYLDSLQLLLDSRALLLIGSEEPHYTASKVFPYILARRPLLTIFHEKSSVVEILREVQEQPVATYSATRPPMLCVPRLTAELERIVRLPQGHEPRVNWSAFQQFTTRAMAGRLAAVFDVAAPRRSAGAPIAATHQREVPGIPGNVSSPS